MSKISMMFKLISILQTHSLINASTIAEYLETSPRNAKAYIEALRREGIPISGISGKKGGYFLREAYYFRPPKLDEKEYIALLLAEKLLTRENGFIYENEIKTGFAKIKSAMGHVMGKTAFADTQGLVLSGGKTDITAGGKEMLFDIYKAILDRKRVSFTYSNRTKKETTNRKIDPYNIVHKESSWYVIGYCHLRNRERMFKLSRIKEFSVLDETFVPPMKYPSENAMRDTFGLISGKEYKVEIQFYHPASVWVSEKKWLPTQTIIHLCDDSIIFKAKVRGLIDIKRWILSYGGLARVIEPPELLESVKEEVEKMRGMYV